MKQDGQDEANVPVHRLSLHPENLENLGNPAWIHKIRQMKRQLLWHVNAAPVGCARLIATDEETPVVAR